MTQLEKYEPSLESQTVQRIADFFAFHATLVDGEQQLTEHEYANAREILNEWLIPPSELYTIVHKGSSAGFLRIGFRGDIAAWIEDIYIDPNMRNRGIATQAIQAAETLVKSRDGYEALCFDVSPRNTAALKLYHKLGYNSLSLVTLRKQFGANKRDKQQELFGLKFNY